jgi:aminoglycoside/choline kinase family phosphotransferase
MTSPHVQRVLASLYGTPAPEAELVRLRGDASTRSYFRAHVETGAPDLPTDLIVMKLPEDLQQSDEGGAQPAAKRLPFLEVAGLLQSRGLPVPKIYAEDLEHGVILLEDLGDLTLYEELAHAGPEQRKELYGRAVDLLANLHASCEELPAESIVARRRFDRPLLDWELEHFREWGLEALFGKLEPRQAATLDRVFATIADRIEAMPYGFVHRDYQSKNLMLRPDRSLALIDFQDALIGPRVYDLVALLCDSYVALDIELQETMIDR